MMPRFAFMIVLSMVVAGCAGGAGKGAQPGPSTSGEATPDGESGSIQGLVVNEEQAPVQGATATVRGLDRTAQTDLAGRFVLDGVPLGTQTLFVERLGYESLARTVEIPAEGALELTLVMKAIATDDEGYLASVNRVFLLHVDNIYLSDCFWNCGVYLNNSAANGIRCDPCQAVLHLTPSPGAVLTEAVWPSSGNMAMNANMCYYYYRDWSETSAGQFLHHNCLTNRMQVAWPAAEVGKLKGAAAIKLIVHGATTGVSYEHRINSWTTFAYGMDLPDGFSALPPA